MPSELLSFESSILHYRISPNEKPYSGQVGQLTVHELYGPSTDPELPPGIYNYQVVIDATVASREEGWEAKFEAYKLADDLDRAWVYVCGRPLHPIHMRLHFDKPPQGWNTNAKEVDVRLAQAAGAPYVIMGEDKSRSWMQLSSFPLREALKVRETLKVASEATLALTDLHYAALKSLDNHGKLFLLANALELGNRLLPGKNKKARDKFLSDNIGSQMSKSLGWLFEMSNFRFDVRHVVDQRDVVKDRPEPKLHQRMTADERITFTEDADLVIRFIVCRQIGRPTFVVKQQ